MDNKTYDVIIAGGGPAGYTAAMYAARSGYTVAVVEQMVRGRTDGDYRNGRKLSGL